MANRRKKCSYINHLDNNNIKFIELMRTKNGYGFTLSGEMPCMLTQVKGLAYTSGLRSGDYLKSVNGQNVSKMSHEMIVQLITCCSDAKLKLQIIENNNYYSSNSEDTDSQSEPKQILNQRPRYPYRHRKSSNTTASNSSIKENILFNNSNNNKNREKCQNRHNHFHHNNERIKRKEINSLSPICSNSRSNEGLLDLILEQRLSKINNNLSDTDSHERQNIETINIDTLHNSLQKTLIERKAHQSNRFFQRRDNLELTQDINQVLYPSLERIINNNESRSDIREDLHSSALIRAVIGYLGTIEMPKESNIDAIVIKNCIRRIRSENKVHTTILLAVYPKSIILVNIEGQLIAQFSAETILSYGICAEDKKFFGLITTIDNRINKNDNISQTNGNLFEEQEQESSYSCHVFVTTPSIHQIHYRTAINFGIKCTSDPVTTDCLEFPESSDSILRVIVGLYRNRLGSYRAAIGLANVNVNNVNNSSSNSDSGIQDSNTCLADHQINRKQTNFYNNCSYNTQQLEAQLNAINMRQTVQKYFKLKQNPNQRDFLNSITAQQLSNHPLNHLYSNSDNILTDLSDDCGQHNKHNEFVAEQVYYEHNIDNIVDNNADNNDENNDDNNDDNIETENEICVKSNNTILNKNDNINRNIIHKDDDYINLIDNQIKTKEADNDLSSITDEESDGTQSALFEGKAIRITSKTKKWIKPATLCKENLELNNEITLGYDCLETKSSMSLEGMAPMSDSVSASASVVSERPIDVGWVGGWAQDFEKLLSDNVGLNVFAEFLKKEFSYENLQFWMSCEQFKKLTNQLEMKREAKNIFDRHLCIGAAEPVNVDSHARLVAQKGLNDPNPLLFSLAEKQIFNLMKFDCYQRFLKSDIYKECVSLELQGKPLLFENTIETKFNDRNNDEINSNRVIKPKKRSLIPWKRSHKTRKDIKKEPMMRKLSDSLLKNRFNSKTSEDQMSRSTGSANRSDFTGSQSSITSSEPIDKSSASLAALSKSKESLNESNLYQMSAHCNRDDCHLSRVILPDRSQTVVPLIQGQKIGQMIQKLLDKRNLNYSAFDAFVTGSDKPLDQNNEVSILGCNEIRVEQRILFQLDFPNKEIIGIKARSSKLCGDVFRPLLNKYGYKLEHVVLQIANSSKCVTSNMPITLIDNKRIIVCIKDDLEEWGWDVNYSRIPVALDKTRTPTDGTVANRMINNSFSSQIIAEPIAQIDSCSGKENYSHIKNNQNINKDYREECDHYFVRPNDISFSDDTKSEAFFRDLMLSSQHIPLNENTFSLSPKPMAQNQNSLKTMTDSNLSLGVKPIQTTDKTSSAANYKSEIKFSQCNLSPIQRINSNLNIINDIDLDQTLKSLQMSNNKNNNTLTGSTLNNSDVNCAEMSQLDETLTPTKIAYPLELDENCVLVEMNVANYTPPTPIHSTHLQTMPILSNMHKSPIRRLSSDPPPLPPKGSQRERGPPPRPPLAKHYFVGINHNNNDFIRNIDQSTDKSDISFV